jgi:hypothetical protein
MFMIAKYRLKLLLLFNRKTITCMHRRNDNIMCCKLHRMLTPGGKWPLKMLVMLHIEVGVLVEMLGYFTDLLF